MQNKQDSIQVFIRVKPGELDDCLSFTDKQIKLDKYHFGFDKIFNPNATQDDVFNSVGKKLLANTLDGYHGCVFVYGQTGSGKTYTMIGSQNGLMQRSFQQLFIRLDAVPNAQCIVTCSYFQLYNQQILDLLDPKKDKKLSIRQDSKKGIFVQNLNQQTALNSTRLLQCLNTGMKNRHVGETMMNRQSSRSHSVFTISLSCKMQKDGSKILKTPKLHFVDLAGSERQKLTAASGQRLKQAGNINKSLTTLGMVINALTSDKPKSHIPYRDSKLTCLLRNSLGGNSKTIIIATVSSSVMCFQQTLSTLNFANRAKMVKVKAQINQQSFSTNIQAFKQQIKKLKAQIFRLKNQKKVQNNKQSVDIQNFQYHFQQINNKISVISQQLSKNICSPAFQNIIQKLQNGKIQKKQSMINQDDQQQNNVLIQYLSSNYQLLSQVNQKVNQYLDMKNQLRMTAISGKLSIQSIKSPSKGQRQQYDCIINQRQQSNKQLRQQIFQLRQIIVQKDIKILQLTQKLKQKKSIELQTINKQQILIKQKQIISLKSKYNLIQQQFNRINKNYNQLQITSKQLRQLYHYNQQKLQSQIFIKNKLQKNFKNSQFKIQQLQNQLNNIKQQYQLQLDHLRNNIQNLQNIQSQLKGQISVLESTVQFHQKKSNQNLQKYKYLQAITQKNKVQILNLKQQLKANQNSKYQIEIKIQKMQRLIKQLQENQQENSLKLHANQVYTQHIVDEFNNYKSKIQQQLLISKQEVKVSKLNNDQLSRQLNYINNQFNFAQKQHQDSTQKYELQIEKYMKNIKQLNEKLNQLINNYQQILKSYNLIKQQKQKLQQNNQQYQISINQKKTQIIELKTIIENSKNLMDQNAMLKKTYLQVVKDNYKLKGNVQKKYQNSDQLVCKVQYYQQKFKLMSLEYKKATDSVKKLKQKQIQQLKIIKHLQEKIKYIKINHDQQQLQEIIKQLKNQNQEIKQKLNCFQGNNHYNIQSEQHQLHFRNKLQQLLNKWGSIKMNYATQMSIDQLISAWEKIQTQSRKKLQSLTQNIQRQQKLKSQNNFILKENIYLKQKVNSLEKQLELNSRNPRKLIKTNQ